MGMFDSVISHYPLFGYPWDLDLQTKSFDCLMSTFWIDPEGRLFEIDYSYTHDWVETPQEERRGLFDSHKVIPNGNRGKVRPVAYWGHIHIYPGKTVNRPGHDGQYLWIEKTLIFKAGQITHSLDTPKRIRSPGTLL